MKQDIPIEHKRGFGTDSECCILVKADVSSISKIFREYLSLKVLHNCRSRKFFRLYNQYNDRHLKLESILRQDIPVDYRNKLKKKIDNSLRLCPIWRFKNHSWSIIGFKGNQYDIAYACSTLLNTDVLTYWMPKHDDCSELKLFRGDRLVEHYQFGSQCGEPCDNYWDVIVDLYPNTGWESHRFSSLIRQVTKVEIEQTVKYSRDSAYDSGFLNECVTFHDAYFSTEQETPYCYIYPRSNAQMSRFTGALEQMDVVMLPNNWNYHDWKVPRKIVRN